MDLEALFRDPSMFDSRDAWRRAGFTIVAPGKPTECMVASHPSAPGVLFKKYANDNLSTKKQNKNYATRIEGATKLASFITKERLAHVVVPNKQVRDLPRRFGKDARIMIVDWLDIYGPDESMARYRDMAEPVLRELLRVIVKFKGLDSNAKNIPFTKDGKIAFVDLEHWDHREDDKDVRLKSIENYLSNDKLKLARKILDDLL
jgi:hypothetical protein